MSSAVADAQNIIAVHPPSKTSLKRFKPSKSAFGNVKMTWTLCPGGSTRSPCKIPKPTWLNKAHVPGHYLACRELTNRSSWSARP
jgi:hypothetical protein